MGEARAFDVEAYSVKAGWFIECNCGNAWLVSREGHRVGNRRVCPGCQSDSNTKVPRPVWVERTAGEVTKVEYMGRFEAAEMQREAMGLPPKRPAVRVTKLDHDRRTITVAVDGMKPLPKNKKQSGRSPTRRVLRVKRGGR